MKGARFGETIGELVHWKLEDGDDAGEYDELIIGSPCPDCGDPLRYQTSSREDMEAIVGGYLRLVRNRHGTVH
jgi:transposase